MYAVANTAARSVANSLLKAGCSSAWPAEHPRISMRSGGSRAGDFGHERVQHGRGEVRLPPLGPHGRRLIQGQRPPVGAIASQGIEDVGNRGDPALDRDVIAAE